MLSEKADGKMAKAGLLPKAKGGAPIGNQNNKKPEGEAKTHWIKMRVRPQDKSRAVREAQDAGMTLSAYIAYKMGWK